MLLFRFPLIIYEAFLSFLLLFLNFFLNFSSSSTYQSFQGEYIKHPVILYELSHKYGLTDNTSDSALPDRLEEIKEAIRREIRKELKVSKNTRLKSN